MRSSPQALTFDSRVPQVTSVGGTAGPQTDKGYMTTLSHEEQYKRDTVMSRFVGEETRPLFPHLVTLRVVGTSAFTGPALGLRGSFNAQDRRVDVHQSSLCRASLLPRPPPSFPLRRPLAAPH